MGEAWPTRRDRHDPAFDENLLPIGKRRHILAIKCDVDIVRTGRFRPLGEIRLEARNGRYRRRFKINKIMR